MSDDARSDAIWPDDIDPQSRSRLPLPRREDLSGDALALYDRHTDPAGDSLAGLYGPGGLKLHSPGLAAAWRPLSDYLRHDAGFALPIRELAILIAAREMDSRFEWAAHEPEARRVGLSPAAIEAVRLRRPTDGLPEEQAVLIEFGRALFRDRHVPPALFARALAAFGRVQLVNLVALMGQYANTALFLAAFDARPPPDDGTGLPV